MSEKTAVEQFAAEVLKYKNPINLNGTDYVMIPINKLEYLKEKFKEVEKEQKHKDFTDGYMHGSEPLNHEVIDKWYNETYGGNNEQQ